MARSTSFQISSRWLSVLCAVSACGTSNGAPPPTGNSGSGSIAGSAGLLSAGGSAGLLTGTSGGAGASSDGGGNAGLAGSGGNAGPAGSGGNGGQTGGAGTSGAGGPCGGGTIFCSDFEAAALPATLTFYPQYLRSMEASYVSLDPTIGHSGTHSVKVVGTGSSQMLGIAVPSKFWGRVYLRSDSDIQNGHDTYLAAGTDASGDQNSGTYIRIGEHINQLELNRSTDDKELLSNGGDYNAGGGVKFVANTWYCVEFFYDGPGSEVSVFVDGTEASALHATGFGPYDYKLFEFGFEKYGGAAKTLWYDDLALGTAKIGCL